MLLYSFAHRAQLVRREGFFFHFQLNKNGGDVASHGVCDGGPRPTPRHRAAGTRDKGDSEGEYVSTLL